MKIFTSLKHCVNKKNQKYNSELYIVGGDIKIHVHYFMQNYRKYIHKGFDYVLKNFIDKKHSVDFSLQKIQFIINMKHNTNVLIIESWKQYSKEKNNLYSQIRMKYNCLRIVIVLKCGSYFSYNNRLWIKIVLIIYQYTSNCKIIKIISNSPLFRRPLFI